nr:dna replication licensing factor mcm9 [Hymenolepis microstoma]
MKKLQHSSKADISSLFSEFVKKEYIDTIKKQLESNETSSESNVFPLFVNFSSLCEFNSILSQHLLSSPLDTLSIFNKTLTNIVLDLFETVQSPIRCLVRIVSLPPVSEVFRSTIPQSDFVGRFFALQCTVTRVGTIQVVQLERSFICTKCGHGITVEADFCQYFSISQPRRCTNTVERCPSTSFNVVSENNSSLLHCFQEIRVNERLSCLAVGSMPKSMTCCLDADLVDSVRPGDDIILNGILTHRWRTPRVGAPCEIETVFRANSIENLSEMRFKGELGSDNFAQELGRRFKNYWKQATSSGDFKLALRLRDEIVRNICPDVYGLYFVKLSLVLVLVGAPPCSEKYDIERTLIENTNQEKDERKDFRVRGNLHLLLVGEPSTAKSALLRVSCRLAGRAIFTAATGTTAAGLTAAAVRDSSGWALEAGALVLADGGVCAIDEFTSLRGADRAAVHEAMEQQTVSIAKAGLVARLNCRCSVIAASTLSSDDSSDASDILPTPLLSRFDLVWRMFDPVGCEAWDSAVADHVLGFRSVERGDTEEGGLFKSVGRIAWTAEELRNYIAWVRGEFQPRLSKGAALLLQRYYELRRRTLQKVHGAEQEQAVAGRTTLRLLESLVRLTQAHARLMARDRTVIEDAVVAIWLMDCSIQSTFGRSASAVEVDGHCVTPEETVTRHGIENDFDDIVGAIFDQLNIRPEELDLEWFGSDVKEVDFQPVCVSTQIARDQQKIFIPNVSSFVKEDTFKLPENAFDFDIDSFMPSGFDSFEKEQQKVPDKSGPTISSGKSVEEVSTSVSSIKVSKDFSPDESPNCVSETGLISTIRRPEETAKFSDLKDTEHSNISQTVPVRFSKSVKWVKTLKDSGVIEFPPKYTPSEMESSRAFSFKKVPKNTQELNTGIHYSKTFDCDEKESEYSFRSLSKIHILPDNDNLQKFESVKPSLTSINIPKAKASESIEKDSRYSFNSILKRNSPSGSGVRKSELEKACTSSAPASQPSSKFGSRVKSKLSRFAFVEDEQPLSLKQSKPSSGKVDLLNLQNLAPEDWNFSNLDADFDF